MRSHLWLSTFVATETCRIVVSLNFCSIHPDPVQLVFVAFCCLSAKQNCHCCLSIDTYLWQSPHQKKESFGPFGPKMSWLDGQQWEEPSSQSPSNLCPWPSAPCARASQDSLFVGDLVFVFVIICKCACALLICFMTTDHEGRALGCVMNASVCVCLRRAFEQPGVISTRSIRDQATQARDDVRWPHSLPSLFCELLFHCLECKWIVSSLWISRCEIFLKIFGILVT